MAPSRTIRAPLRLAQRVAPAFALALSVSSVCAQDAASAKSAAPAKPNLLFVFSDQQHGRAAGFLDPFFVTPNLDRLADDAYVFENAFCATPQCSPSRAAILTGLVPSTTGVLSNIGSAGTRPLALATIAPSLQAAGYRTGYFGKWHLGEQQQAVAGWDGDAGVSHPAPENDADAVKRAVEFLSEVKSGDPPFALFVSLREPHDVYDFDPAGPRAAGLPDVPMPESWEKGSLADRPAPQRAFMAEDRRAKIMKDVGADGWMAYRRFYRERVRRYDEQLGLVLDALRARGLLERTIVVVTSDHGDMDAAHHLVFKGPFMYDEVVRVPLVVRVPAAFGGKTGSTSSLVVLCDLAPTLLDFAGAEPPRDGAAGAAAPRRFDGISLRPWLTGAAALPQRDFVVAQYFGKQHWVVPIRMIRTRDWKYVVYAGGAADGDELYDLVHDPGEIVNLANEGKDAATKAELHARLEAWMAVHHDPFDRLVPAGSAADADDAEH